MATEKSITVAEWLDRFMDLDAYIANGGSLLDLPVDSLDTLPPDMVRSLVKQMGRERLNQFGRLREHQGNSADDATRMGEVLTPQQVQAPGKET